MRRGVPGALAAACAAASAVAFAGQGPAQGPGPTNGGFEEKEQGWEVASRGSATVGFDAKGTEGQRALQVTVSGGEAVVHQQASGVAWGTVVELDLRCLVERGSEGVRVVADFAAETADLPREGPTWWGDLPADGKWHRVGIKLLLPPGPDGAEPRLALGAGGPHGTVLLDGVALAVAAKPPPQAPQPAPALPLGWQPEGTLDAVPVEVGDETDYRAEVGSLEFTIQPTGEAELGQAATLQAIVTNRDRQSQELIIAGDSSLALACVERSLEVPMGTGRALVRVQGLLPGDHWTALSLRCGAATARVPVHVQVAPALPTCGVSAPAVGPLSGPAWPVREVVLSADQLADPSAAAQQLRALVAGRPETLIVHLAAPVPEGALTVLVGEAADAVTGWGPCRREVPVGPEVAVAPLAAELVEQTRLLARVVRERDAFGVVLSPVFRWEANDAGTPEGQLLRACLEAGLLEVTDALALAGPELPATGATLLESLDGKWRDTAAAPWAAWDAALVPSGVDALRRELGLDWEPVLVSGLRCGSTGDAWLDALLAARAAILATWEGEEGATFPAPQADAPWIGLEAGEGDSIAGWAVRELLGELSGAAPMVPEEPDAAVSRRPGAPITFRAFSRGDEEVVCLWNHSSSPADVELRLSTDPAALEMLDLSYGSAPFVRREHVEPFRYQKAAIKRGERLEALTITPLQVLCYRFRFPNRALFVPWLAAVGLAPQEGRRGPRPLHEEGPWWQVLQERFRPKENERERG